MFACFNPKEFTLEFCFVRKCIDSSINISAMTPEDIYQFFEAGASKFLTAEAAVGYILHTLLQRDTYGTELKQQLTQQHPSLNVSDTVIYEALRFLEHEQFIVRYTKQLEGRGRPRQMFRLVPAVRPQAQELAQLWEGFVARH